MQIAEGQLQIERDRTQHPQLSKEQAEGKDLDLVDIAEAALNDAFPKNTPSEFRNRLADAGTGRSQRFAREILQIVRT